MQQSLEARVRRMFRRDIAAGVTLAVLMWTAIVFVFLTATSVVPDRTVLVAFGVAGVVLGTFNTASLIALIRRYGIRRDHIYVEDITALDAARSKVRERSDDGVPVGVGDA